MLQPTHTQTRRRLIGVGVVALAGGLAVTAAKAQGKTPKADVKYQFTPHGNEMCGLCTSFIPGGSPKGPGTCKIVEAPIPQDGWCILFSSRR